MIGYCATASSGIEIAPIKQMKSATTQAKIGLSMKKPGILSPARLLLRVRRRVRLGPGLRPDLVAGCNLLETFDHDLVAGLQAIGDEPHAVLQRADLDRLDSDATVIADDKHLAAAAAVALDRLLRHRNGIGVDAQFDLHAHVHAR